MIRGLQSAAAGMTAEVVRQDVIAHNLSNADTAGFRRLVLTQRNTTAGPIHRRDAVGPALGTVTPGPGDPVIALDPRSGPIVETGDPLDLAIDGDGYLVVDGNRLVRSGRLGVDRQGFLTVSDVRVLGARGPISVGNARVSVLPDGTVQGQGGETLGTLRYVTVPHDQLEPIGAGMLRPRDGAAARDAKATFHQGARERPNVNAVEELVQMIAGMRSYEAAAKAMQASDETLARAADQVARLG